MGNFRKDKLTQNDLMYQFTSKPISRIKYSKYPFTERSSFAATLTVCLKKTIKIQYYLFYELQYPGKYIHLNITEKNYSVSNKKNKYPEFH